MRQTDFILWILLSGVKRAFSSDLIFVSPESLVTPPTPDWESLVFWVSNGVGSFGKTCREFSQYYCLDSYHTYPRTQFENDYPGDVALEEIVKQETTDGKKKSLDPDACAAWFNILIQEKWTQINMIDFYNPLECCDMHVQKYMAHGLEYKGMSPDQFMHRLTDYDNEDNKPLNFISATYIQEVCLNMILEIGFGPGNFRRDHTNNVKEGFPYVIAGQEMGQVGIPFINSTTFDYHNVANELTFHWFKHNIMCEDNPWICGKTKNSRKGNRSLNKGKGKTSSGSKKNKRKNKRIPKDAGSSSNVELRRHRLT